MARKIPEFKAWAKKEYFSRDVGDTMDWDLFVCYFIGYHAPKCKDLSITDEWRTIREYLEKKGTNENGLQVFEEAFEQYTNEKAGD